MDGETKQVQITLIEDEEIDFSERTFCVECGEWDVDENHECERQAAA